MASTREEFLSCRSGDHASTITERAQVLSFDLHPATRTVHGKR